MIQDAPFYKAVRSLTFAVDTRAVLTEIAATEWPALLDRMDRSQITLPIAERCRDFLPDTVAVRTARNLASNTRRHERLFAEYRTVAKALNENSVPFVILKGLSHTAPSYVHDICHRPQYDIDLYTPPEFTDRARRALSEVGFTPATAAKGRTDHLPPMIRDRNWTWRGDYYDPDLPLTVEIHFRLWDPASERISAKYTEAFWERRTKIDFCGLELPVLSPGDRVSYAALHLVRHLLRGDIRAYHVYELAHFLHYTKEDDSLWLDWRQNHGGETILQAIAFRLAKEWFGCLLHPVAQETVNRLPSAVVRWFEIFAFSPLAVDGPNKDELFLHLSLLEHPKDRYFVLARRLFPKLPGKLVSPPGLASNALFEMRTNLSFVLQRARHHLKTILPLAKSWRRWTHATP